MQQQSEAWFAARLGRVTASRIADVMARTKTGYSASRKNYMMQLLCERMTGRKEESYVNAAMQRGTDLEPLARSSYEVDRGVMVMECGFVAHPSIPMAGASPDGLVNDDGLIEIKCPNTATHVEFLRTGHIDNDYILQMHWQMVCTSRGWCDFVSYDDRMPQELAFKCKRVNLDAKLMLDITGEVSKFLRELDELEKEMKSLIPIKEAA